MNAALREAFTDGIPADGEPSEPDFSVTVPVLAIEDGPWDAAAEPPSAAAGGAATAAAAKLPSAEATASSAAAAESASEEIDISSLAGVSLAELSPRTLALLPKGTAHTERHVRFARESVAEAKLDEAAARAPAAYERRTKNSHQRSPAECGHEKFKT